ncbi:hypothetical protein ACFWUQ_26340 [Streptomyces sp. NPDC058662]|uniref:hypothetical protein n=1 Tax=Streptomyces sp. NPDC058662 TaxID=3346583 RepID=UPI00365C18DC
MADLYALDLAFDLDEATPDTVLAELRRQLAPSVEDAYEDPYASSPLLAARGPALRIGGVLVGEFTRGARGGWALTARQEIHEEQLPDLEDLLTALAPHIRPPGPVGRLRHYEHEAPDLLVLREGRVVQLALDRR